MDKDEGRSPSDEELFAQFPELFRPVSPRVRRAVDSAEAEAVHIRNLQEAFQLMMSQGITFSKAADLGAELVESTGNNEVDLGLAQELLDEHESLNRATSFAGAILNKGADPSALKGEQRNARTKGAFLEEYKLRDILARVKQTGGPNPHWVMTRSHGRIIEPNGRVGDLHCAGGIHVELPTPWEKAIAKDLFPAGNKLSFFSKEAKEKFKSMKANLQNVAVVRDIYSLDAHMGFASVARDLNFRRIMQLNAEREPETQITDILAAVFLIRGLKLPNGETIMLEKKEQIENIISLLIHVKSDKYPSEPLWTVQEHNVPVPELGEGYELITDWSVLGTDFREVQQRAVTDGARR